MFKEPRIIARWIYEFEEQIGFLPFVHTDHQDFRANFFLAVVTEKYQNRSTIFAFEIDV